MMFLHISILSILRVQFPLEVRKAAFAWSGVSSAPRINKALRSREWGDGDV